MKEFDDGADQQLIRFDDGEYDGAPLKYLLEVIKGSGGGLAARSQYVRISELVNQAQLKPFTNPHPISLFPNLDEDLLGTGTIVSSGLVETSVEDGEEILLQLLPYWLVEAENEQHLLLDADMWAQQLLGAYEVCSKFPKLIDRIKLAKYRTSKALNSRATQFSRSAHYMGSKAFLAPYLAEIIHTLLPESTVILDLMCGSGAASGQFSREWRTLASDAQEFSRLLAGVQGGGFDGARASIVAEKVLAAARIQYTSLPRFFVEAVKVENEYLSSELTPDVVDSLYRWISTYPRVNNTRVELDAVYSDLINCRQSDNTITPYLLFSTYYGNLFFGVRQAAEIDCLRYAIEQIEDADEQAWALGALICATSSCAYSYGGHFAQPKYDGVSEERLRVLASDLIVCRGLSVSHEFFVRLISLGEESQKNRFKVESVPGPWQTALDASSAVLGSSNVCVYLDPPYTRDEYSRYYHVLETLIRYDYPVVQDKASMPKRGYAGRFASAFATRNTAAIEDLIVEIVEDVLSRGWSCLLSYSSVGVASLNNIIGRVSVGGRKVDIFGMNHSYKGQGKHKSKAVREYAVMLRP